MGLDGKVRTYEEEAPCLYARDYKEPMTVGINVVAKTRPTKQNYGEDRERVLGTDGISQALRGTDWKDPVKVVTTLVVAKENDQERGWDRIGQVPYENGRTNNKTGVYDVENGVPAIMACHSKDPYRVAIPVMATDKPNKKQNGRRIKEDGDEAFTLTEKDRHGVAVEVEPKVIGGIGEKNYGKQWRQGNRIYDSEAVATSIAAHPVGNAGGQTNLYSVEVTGHRKEH